MSKFYWLKLKRDFFKRHDMMNLASMENGLVYSAIFIHLMAESVDHDASLRFSEKKPYTAKTLAPICNTDEATMKKALDTLEDLELIEIMDNGTIFIPLAAENLGSETSWAEKKRNYRDKPRTDEGQTEDKKRTDRGQKEDMSDKSIEIRDKSKRLEIRDKEREKEREAGTPALTPRSKFVKPTLEEVKAYCEERKNSVDAERFISYYESVGWRIGGKSPMKDWKAAVRNWETRKDVSGTARIQKDEVPYMQKEYSKEYLDQKELDSLSELDRLLEEE